MVRATSIRLTSNVYPLNSRGSGIITSQLAKNHANPLELVNLGPLMEINSGRPETVIGLIDGPVAIGHPDLQSASIREIPGKLAGTCAVANSVACMHGTLVAGILSAKRGSATPAICPACTLLVRPLFAELSAASGELPSATPAELAEAIIDCVSFGAQVINLSAALAGHSARDESRVVEALNYCGKRGVIVVAAAGNQGTVGSSCITRHPWVIPVIACDLRGRPINYSNIGNSIGRRGLRAPGEGVYSLGVNGNRTTFSGTSAAAPFVTGTIALLKSIFPRATAQQIRSSVTQNSQRRPTIVPPLLDAWGAYQRLIRGIN